MKKLVLWAVLAASATTLRAQSIEAGTISLGGSVGYSHSNNESSSDFTTSQAPYTSLSSEITASQFSFMPSVSYFVADNLAIGLAGGVGKGWYNELVTYIPAVTNLRRSENSTTSFSIGPYAQYYKMLTAQFGITGRLGGGYQHSKEVRLSTDSGQVDASYRDEMWTSGFYADLTPGLLFLPVPKFGITATMGGLGFNHSTSRSVSNYNSSGASSTISEYSGKGNTFGARFGLDYLQLGGSYFFGR